MLERRAKWLARAAGAVFLLLLLLTLGQLSSIVRMGITGWAFLVLPMPFYLFAMFSTWRSLHLVGNGGKLAPALSSLMRRAGIALFIGGLVEVFAVPAWIGAYDLPGQPINITAIVIGVIGVGLYGISGLIEEARAARAELEEFI